MAHCGALYCGILSYVTAVWDIQVSAVQRRGGMYSTVLYILQWVLDSALSYSAHSIVCYVTVKRGAISLTIARRTPVEKKQRVGCF